MKCSRIGPDSDWKILSEQKLHESDPAEFDQSEIGLWEDWRPQIQSFVWKSRHKRLRFQARIQSIQQYRPKNITSWIIDNIRIIEDNFVHKQHLLNKNNILFYAFINYA